MADATGRRLARGNGGVERCNVRSRVGGSTDRVANAPARPRVEDQRNVEEPGNYRYSHGSKIATNKGIKDWPKLTADDAVLATAILNWLRHHAAIVVKIKDRCYRLRDLKQIISLRQSTDHDDSTTPVRKSGCRLTPWKFLVRQMRAHHQGRLIRLPAWAPRLPRQEGYRGDAGSRRAGTH